MAYDRDDSGLALEFRRVNGFHVFEDSSVTAPGSTLMVDRDFPRFGSVYRRLHDTLLFKECLDVIYGGTRCLSCPPFVKRHLFHLSRFDLNGDTISPPECPYSWSGAASIEAIAGNHAPPLL
ncbi:uncharacterized protein Nmag_4057 (plasmid) [Natrialba magadii ATCC 43099]|uniref:Uncharacterized protein n=1 Tax=Natrialba magadii (strain ATCC 43099 / DSM 3394 / CCM 3739 / CIP 104546 / IAM 13178 / JCM 8861 / NBRC 102185 / NCIMB 2190 / MS3) TaxID=547559 RepID=D3T1X6_NATMM|nr:uncharacterized protein Nmag_4057 [Natrialba magadii ATCC 43099]